MFEFGCVLGDFDNIVIPRIGETMAVARLVTGREGLPLRQPRVFHLICCVISPQVDPWPPMGTVGGTNGVPWGFSLGGCSVLLKVSSSSNSRSESLSFETYPAGIGRSLRLGKCGWDPKGTLGHPASSGTASASGNVNRDHSPTAPRPSHLGQPCPWHSAQRG